LTFKNPDSVSHTRILYFPKGWQNLECYFPQFEATFEQKNIGIQNHQEVIYASIPPLDTLVLYVKYPEKSKAYIPFLNIREMTEVDYLAFQSRTRYKFLLIGVLLFPFLFFFAQFMVQKDKLSFYYLLFLLGSATYLLTMLDTIPFFELSPKIIESVGTIHRLFVLSTIFLLIGMVKYIHILLDVSSWSRLLLKTGDILLGGFLLMVLIPFFYTPIFLNDNYQIYLRYFRVLALSVFVYVLFLNVRAVLAKVKFSNILFLAFSPFIISGIWYASSFILFGGFTYHSAESLTMIVGFILTLLLFGVVLGVRNNAIKMEKIRLQQIAERLNELDHFKSRFYTNITHEFRTPLTVIKGMIGQVKGNEKVKTMIRRNCDRLLNMVNQLLDLSKLEANSLSINWVHGNIIPYLQYLTESCHSLAKNKYLNLAFFSNEECVNMDFDENKMQHILINLLSNAIKFTPEYGTVKVITSRISENGTPFFKLAVKDTGRGIPHEKIVHIFDRFFQGDDSSTSLGEGSGIGLSLVRELVNLFDGRIEVESDVGIGSCFLVYLPIHHKAQIEPISYATSLPVTNLEEAADVDNPEQESIPGNEKKPLLLIIEDNIDVTNYIISCLKQDYSLQTAPNGKKGIDKAIKDIPDVILSDVMMPEMDGFEVCQHLKSDRRTSHIPIILLTAKSTQEDKLAGLAQGADAYLTKPFDKEELLIRLTNLTVQSKLLRERLSATSRSNSLPDEKESKEAAFLQELYQIVESNMSNELFNTNYLCQSIAMSRTQLHRKLKALTDQSTASYIRTIRLQRAKHLLEKTDMQIGEIAIQVGYKDFSHFSRSFYKEFDAKPSETRN
jgi:signal transduction histidine kinase/DNA-binding response OmpR family regulator